MSNKPYKKRVINESDDEDEDDVPLAARASKPANGSGEGESAEHAQAVAAGTAIIHATVEHKEDAAKEATGLEDASARHEIAAGGFPVDPASIPPPNGVHADSSKGTNGQQNGKMDVDGESSEDDEPLSAKAGNGIFVKKEADSSDDEKPLAAKVKPPAKTNGKKRRSSDDSSDEDVPLAKAAESKKAAGNVKKEDDSSDDEPLAAQKPKKAPKKKRAKKDESDDDFDDDDDKPAKKKTKKAPRAKKVKDESPASSPAPSNAAAALKGKGRARVKKEESVDSGAGTPVKGKKGKQKVKEEGSQNGDDSEDEAYKWWKAKAEGGASDDEEDGPKWTTLQHNGVLFPPEYEPLPSNVKLKYDGKPVDLPPESEEVAGFFGAMLNTDHAKDPTFQKNFFRDFLSVLAQYPPRNKIKIGENDFNRLDFNDILIHYETEREKRKSLTKDEKKRIKDEKDELEKPFKTCYVDGRPEVVGNFRLEPPGLFRGRGEHPKKGTLKLRLRAEDITLNIGKEAEIPKPPEGQNWGHIQHDPNVTWLATWKENVNGNTKYVFLAAGSSWKGQSDLKKFEKARKLKSLIGRIRADYEADLTSKVMADRQRATAVYFIDRFALRVGNEKGEDEADTVGCCSLRYEHVTLKEPNLVTFDFLGKDSIRFYQPDKEVELQVFKNLKLFKKGSEEGADLFDRINPTILNKFFGSYMKGLSAKVFRTYNASILLQQQLASTPPDANVADKILHYNRANRLVAEMCNHQRAASKTHGAAMEKLADKVRALKYQRMKLRYTLWAVDEGNKKKHKEYRDPESDLDDDWCEKYEEELAEKEKQKIRKRVEKENEKAKAEGEKGTSEKELNKLLEEAAEVTETAREEREKKYVEPKKAQTTAKVLDALVKIDARIDAQKIAAVDKEEGKEVSLTTSKINYMDPRVTVAWCKKFGIPVEKMFSKSLRTKFVWAMGVEADWEFVSSVLHCQ